MEVLGRVDPLSREWARAQRYWTPLSLIAVDVSALRTAYDRERVRRWLAEVCREVDVACRTGETSFCVILPATNRTGAEAELARLISDAERSIDPRAGKVGFGLAVAFDEANTPLELKMLAERDAEADRERPDPHETPTMPQLGSKTWLELVEERPTLPHPPG
jgi:hypothetical protein